MESKEVEHTLEKFKIHSEEIKHDTDLLITIESDNGLCFCQVWDQPNEDIGWAHNQARHRAQLIIDAPETAAERDKLKEETKRLKEEREELIISLRDVYLEMQIKCIKDIAFAIQTDSIRAGLRNDLARITESTTEIIQLNIEAEAIRKSRGL